MPTFDIGKPEYKIIRDEFNRLHTVKQPREFPEFTNTKNTELVYCDLRYKVVNYWKQIVIYINSIGLHQISKIAEFTDIIIFRGQVNIYNNLQRVRNILHQVHYECQNIPPIITRLSNNIYLGRIKSLNPNDFKGKHVYFTRHVCKDVLESATKVVVGLYVTHKDNMYFNPEDLGQITGTNLPLLRERVYNAFWQPYLERWLPLALVGIVRKYISLSST